MDKTEFGKNIFKKIKRIPQGPINCACTKMYLAL